MNIQGGKDFTEITVHKKYIPGAWNEGSYNFSFYTQ